MAVLSASTSIILVMFVIISSSKGHTVNTNPVCPPSYPEHAAPIYKGDREMLKFAENIEHMEADFFLWGVYGFGLDHIAPQLTWGGPPPIGVQKANLDCFTRSMMGEFALEEVGHLRALKTTVGGIRRPLMDFSPHNFAKLINEAFGYELVPPFNPYRDGLSFVIASYTFPYLGELGYVGANPNLVSYVTKSLLARLLAIEAGQDAAIREYLSERASEVVHPYNHTVAEFTIRISELRNRWAMCGFKDEGIIVPPFLGAENRSETNVLSAGYNSLAYSRTPQELLRIMYGTGNEHIPGLFFPEGANGRIAREFLGKP